MRIDFTQLDSDPVVFPQENGVQSNQHNLLVHSSIAGLEAEDISTGPLATLVWILSPRRQKILESQIT